MKHERDIEVREPIEGSIEGSIERVADRPTDGLKLRTSTSVLNRVVGLANFRGGQVIEGAPTRRPTLSVLPRVSAYRATFVLLVIIPTLVSWVYLAFLASNQYVAEGRFAVRAAQIDVAESDKQKGAAASVASGSLVSLSGQDAYIVTTYIRSRAVIDDLSKVIDIREIFTRPEGDFWARLKSKATAEELLSYWNGMVTAYVDGPSGVVTVSVRSFRPADSVALANAIIKVSESLVNDVSARARNDALKRTEEEVRKAELQVRYGPWRHANLSRSAGLHRSDRVRQRDRTASRQDHVG